MQLFYAPDFESDGYCLSEEESRHAVRVLRLSKGDTIHVSDGKGNMYSCIVTDPSPKRCATRVESITREYEKLPYCLTMAVAPTKNIDRYEWFLEKATEIGVTEVVPLECDHSERRTIKLDREQKVITAAMKQSLKAYHPTLHDMTKFAQFVRSCNADRKFIAHCTEAIGGSKQYLPDILPHGSSVAILIGPEGDFSNEEIRLAVKCGFEEITLGQCRLRTETAAVVATTMVSIMNSIK